MLTIILICALGALLYRNYAELAHEYNKQRVGIGILGVGIFIIAYLLIAFTLGFIMASNGSLASGSLMMILMLEIISICAGAGVSWIVRLMLKKSWSAKKAAEPSELLDEKL